MAAMMAPQPFDSWILGGFGGGNTLLPDTSHGIQTAGSNYNPMTNSWSAKPPTTMTQNSFVPQGKQQVSSQTQSRLDTLMRGLSGGFSQQAAPMSTSVASLPEVQMPQAGSNPAIAAANSEQNAAFGAAKARAGALGRSALDSLQSELADRGMLGGGTEARGLVDRLSSATNPLSDLNAAQLHESTGIAQHDFDTANENARTAYQGQIAQRGQNIQQQESAARLASEQQQAQRQQQYQLLNSVLSGLSSAHLY